MSTKTAVRIGERSRLYSSNGMTFFASPSSLFGKIACGRSTCSGCDLPPRGGLTSSGLYNLPQYKQGHTNDRCVSQPIDAKKCLVPQYAADTSDISVPFTLLFGHPGLSWGVALHSICLIRLLACICFCSEQQKAKFQLDKGTLKRTANISAAEQFDTVQIQWPL